MLNNDPADRWVNGTVARVASYGLDEQGDPTATVELPDGSLVTTGPYTWEVTQPVMSGGQLTREVVGQFRQLPFRLSWAVTIHKSQGQTLDRVVVDLTGGTFADGQTYVALSRATSLAGLVLTRPVLPKDLKTDSRIRRFLAQRRAERAIGYAFLAVRFVGDTGSRWRPRPVELAVVTDAGEEAVTRLNPDRDMGDAAVSLGISAGDVRFAPTLWEAWPALGPLLSGRIPVLADADEALGFLDWELKRGQTVIAMPIGVDAGAVPRGVSVLDEARAVRDGFLLGAVPEVGDEGLAEPFPRSAGPGYLQLPPAEGGGFVVAPQDEGWFAERLAAKAAATLLDEAAVAVLREQEAALGISLVPEGAGAGLDPAAVLVAGARVVFTGSAYDDAGRSLDREVLEDMASRAGLVPVANVTKTRTDVLVTADAGSRSGKMKKALDYGTPILTVQQFLLWVG